MITSYSVTNGFISSELNDLLFSIDEIYYEYDDYIDTVVNLDGISTMKIKLNKHEDTIEIFAKEFMFYDQMTDKSPDLLKLLTKREIFKIMNDYKELIKCCDVVDNSDIINNSDVHNVVNSDIINNNDDSEVVINRWYIPTIEAHAFTNTDNYKTESLLSVSSIPQT